jgi:glucarate dehydratase
MTSIPILSNTPRVTAMRVIPVAGFDSMLLNLSGAHSPHFTRNLVLLDDNAGHSGVGEVPGDEAIRTVLEQSRQLVTGAMIGDRQNVIDAVLRQFADLDAAGRGLQTYDQRIAIHAATAIESAFLDLLLGEGRQRNQVDVLGYLFFIGDRKRTDLGCRSDIRITPTRGCAFAPRKPLQSRLCCALPKPRRSAMAFVISN